MVKSQAQTPFLNTMQRTTDVMITPKVEAANKIIPNTTNRQNPYNLKNSFIILTSYIFVPREFVLSKIITHKFS